MKNKKILLGFGLSFFLIGILVTQIDWPKVWIELKNAHFLPVIWVTVVWLVHFSMKALRWKYLLPEKYETTFTQRFNALMVGSLATFILPLRAGEFIRPFFLSKSTATESGTGVPFSAGFVSIVLERFFDLVCILGFFFIVSFYIPGLPQWATEGVRGFSLLAGGIFIFILGAALFPKLIRRIIQSIASLLPEKVAAFSLSMTEQVLAGATAIASIKNFSIVTVL